MTSSIHSAALAHLVPTDHSSEYKVGRGQHVRTQKISGSSEARRNTKSAVQAYEDYRNKVKLGNYYKHLSAAKFVTSPDFARSIKEVNEYTENVQIAPSGAIPNFSQDEHRTEQSQFHASGRDIRPVIPTVRSNGPILEEPQPINNAQNTKLPHVLASSYRVLKSQHKKEERGDLLSKLVYVCSSFTRLMFILNKRRDPPAKT